MLADVMAHARPCSRWLRRAVVTQAAARASALSFTFCNAGMSAAFDGIAPTAYLPSSQE